MVNGFSHGLSADDILDLALDASRTGAWRWDIATGVVEWDQRLEALHGLAPGEFRGSFEHWVELLHADEVDGVVATVQSALAAPGRYKLLHRSIWCDGSVHWIECRGRVTVADDGSPTGTVGIAFDVTEHKKTEAELLAAREASASVARRLQESLLGPPVLLKRAGHAARYIPAARGLNVGGDWYNAQRVLDGPIALAVGDVVGSGLEAATVMGQLRSALSTAALTAVNSSQVIETLHAFAATVPGAQCATAIFAFVDGDREHLEYARAGHVPPLLVTPAGEAEYLEDGLGPPLAIGPRARKQSAGSARFPAGSLLVLYSDGLIERRGESLNAGLARLRDSVERHRLQPLEVLCDRIVTDLVDRDVHTDDVVLLTLRTPVVSEQLLLEKIAAEPSELAALRATLAEWLLQAGIPDPRASAFQIAINEACTNVIEHAYLDGAGLIRVEVSRVDHQLVGCVTDTGTWRDSSPAARENGLRVMHGLMDSVEISRRPTGTSVVLRTNLDDALALEPRRHNAS